VDGFLDGPPSDTPQNPWSQPCAIKDPKQQSPDRSDEDALTSAYPKRVGGASRTPAPQAVEVPRFDGHQL